MPSEDTPTNRNFSTTIAARIKHERERRAWTQAEVAERIGSTRVNISRWENGSTIPSFYFRQRLAEIFESNVEELGFVAPISDDIVDNQAISLSSVSTRNSPPWTMPHRRNPFFTGRKEILHYLHSEFQDHHASTSILALSGLGGVGKTQIAIEYAYTYRDDYQAIIWLNATTRDTLRTDLLTLAHLLGLMRLQDDEEIIIQVVKRWLTTHIGWLLILDNVDSLEENILDFLPQDIAGDVLLTTRLQASGTMAHTIIVENMSQDEGITFLLRRTKLLAPKIHIDQINQKYQQQAHEIFDKLGGLPLALDQAGAYIEETNCGLPQYLELYNRYRKELLQRRGRFPNHHPDPVSTTWEVSFGLIEKNWPSSTELLNLCALLDPNSIPEEFLILGALKLGPILSKEISNPLDLDSVLEPLHLYSLIHRSPDDHSLSMHRLVQAVLREELSQEEQKERAERILLALNHTFPEVEQKNWEQCQRLLPQVQIALQLCDEYSLFLPEVFHLFVRAGDYTFVRRRFNLSELFFRKALDISQKLFPGDSTEIALALKNLGELYRVKGDYKKAEPLLRNAETIYKQSTNTDQLDTARTLNCLGELYHNLGRYDEAEPLFQQALVLTNSIVGPDHMETYTTLHHIARLYHVQGHYQEAELTYLQALKGLERYLGPDQVEIATILSNLAITYRKLGKLEKAVSLLKRALDIEEKAFGANDHRTATTLHNLGVIYKMQGLSAEAEDMLQQAYAIKEEALGPGHLSSVKTATNLANLYREQKRFSEAKPLLLRALASNLGEEHPYEGIVIRNLARLYQDEEMYEEVESLYLHSLAILEKYFPIYNTDISLILESLEELYRTLGREEDVAKIEQHQKSLKLRSKRF